MGLQNMDEDLSRSFQILKFKTHKTPEELQACMEYDPYDPDFPIEFANSLLNHGNYEDAVKLLNKSIELSYYYRPQSLYRCAELAQQVSFWSQQCSCAYALLKSIFN